MPPKRRKKQNVWVVPAAIGGGLLLVAVVVTVVLIALSGGDDGSGKSDGRSGALAGKPQAPADDLNAIIAELDKKDPNWRIEQWQKQPAPEKNAATQILAASKHLPRVWPPEALRDVRLDPVNPPNAANIQALRAELTRLAPALAEARRLSQFPSGRFQVAFAKNPYDTPVQHLQDVRKVGTLLSYDVLVKLDEQDIEGALLGCSALFNTARSVGDEPFTISQLVRLALRKSAGDGLARILVHPRPLTDASLAGFQKMLEDELSFPLLKVIFRGERARLHAIHANLAKGELTFAQLQDRLKNRDEAYLRSILTKSHASYVRTYTELAESADAPPERWEEGQARARLARPTPYLDGLDADWAPLTRAVRRGQAQLSCAIAAVACERYRLAEGRLPKMLNDLVPKYVKAMPNNPYSGRPLTWQPNEGVIAADGAPQPEDNIRIQLALRKR